VSQGVSNPLRNFSKDILATSGNTHILQQVAHTLGSWARGIEYPVGQLLNNLRRYNEEVALLTNKRQPFSISLKIQNCKKVN
jgi:hypothetical protein